jgi:hypothetical protein
MNTFALQVNVNGMLSFGTCINTVNPALFPTKNVIIEVYFADVMDVCGSNHIIGDLFYRVSYGKLIDGKDQLVSQC